MDIVEEYIKKVLNHESITSEDLEKIENPDIRKYIELLIKILNAGKLNLFLLTESEEFRDSLIDELFKISQEEFLKKLFRCLKFSNREFDFLWERFHYCPNELDHYAIQLFLENIDSKYLIELNDTLTFWTIKDEYIIPDYIISERNKKNIDIINNPNEYTSNTIQDAIADYFFHDYPQNIIKKISAIFKYIEYNQEYAKENSIYQDILKLIAILLNPEREIYDDMYNKYMSILFNFHKLKNLFTLLDRTYFAIFEYYKRDLQEKSNESCTNVTNNCNSIPIKSDDSSVKMYIIEPDTIPNFYFVVHTTDNINEYMEVSQHRNKLCVSLISGNGSLGVYGYDRSVILGFQGLSAKQLFSLYTHDSNSDGFMGLNTRLRTINSYIPRSIDDFCSGCESDSYNELNFGNIDSNKLFQIKPTFVVSFYNPPTKKSIDTAIKLNIPIYYIDREKHIKLGEKISSNMERKQKSFFEVNFCYPGQHKTNFEKRDVIKML